MSNFNEDMFGCLSDIKVCLAGCAFPCCLQAIAVDKVTGSGLFIPFICVCCLGCFGGAINRGDIRQKLGIHGSFSIDCLVWCFYPECSACQEYREVENRV